MKRILLNELLSLNGGTSAQQDCMWYLQYEANTHLDTGNEKQEDLYWKDWLNRYEECSQSLMRPN